MSELQVKSRVCVVGAAGRMGRRVVRLLDAHPTLVLAAAVDSGPGMTGRDAAELAGVPPRGVRLAADVEAALAGCDVVIDFSSPAACAQLASRCAARGVAYVVASTGLGETDQAAIDAAATQIAVLQAANLSAGVNVMLELVELAARRLAGLDVEIAEIHHRHKRDAPSGTALALGQAVRAGRGGGGATACREVVGRAGNSEQSRAADELGYAALRGGDVAGEHTVFFFGEGERIEITHRSTTADIFAAGALRAAAWLVHQKPGRYSMRDAIEVAGLPQ